MSLFVPLLVLWYTGVVSPRVVCHRSENLMFHCARTSDLGNSTTDPMMGKTKLSVIRRFESGSAYVLCTCPEAARSRFTMTWFIDNCWVTKLDGVDGELIEESIDTRDGWDKRAKVYRGVLYFKKLNESMTYCLRCLCTSENRHFFSDERCVRLADLKQGSVPHKRDWRFSVVAACFAVAGAFVAAGAVLTHLGIRDDASDADVLELIRNPIAVLNLNVVQHVPSDPALSDVLPSSPVVERRLDTNRSRRYTFGCHNPDVPMDGAIRHSI